MGFFGGASKGDEQALTSEKNFMNELTNENQSAFAGAESLATAVQNAWAPVLSQGAYQYGFSSAEDQNLRNQIENTGATATANSINAEELRQQQESGGAATAPSGAKAALEGQMRETGAQATASNLAKEKELGYEVGRQQFENASNASLSAGQLKGSLAASSGNQAIEEGKNVNAMQQYIDEQNQNSLTSKLLGGAITAGLSFIPGVGPMLASNFSGTTVGAPKFGGSSSGGGVPTVGSLPLTMPAPPNPAG